MTRLNIVFTSNAWHEYLDWKKTDRKMVKRIDKLLTDTTRHPFSGVGKPETLQHELSGFWSKKVNDEHRMVYCVTKDAIQIVQLKYHYHK